MSLVSAKAVESWMQLSRQDDKRVLSHLVGFVSVVPTKDNGDLAPQLKGLLAPGIANTVRIVNRRIQVDSYAPEWFKEAVMDEFCKPEGLRFRVRVTGWSKSGTYLYVTPLARNLEHAKTEWAREVERDEKVLPKSELHCQTAESLANYVYRKYADELGYTILHKNPEHDNVVVVEKDCRTLWYMSGALEIWNFTDGIKTGATTLKNEINMCVKLTKISA